MTAASRAAAAGPTRGRDANDVLDGNFRVAAVVAPGHVDIDVLVKVAGPPCEETMPTMRAVVVALQAPAHLGLHVVDRAKPGPSDALVRVAVQLAYQADGSVVGRVRKQDRAALIREAGAHEVVVNEDAAAAEAFGPYHLVNGVGGMLAPGGVCVACGATAGRACWRGSEPNSEWHGKHGA